MVWAGCEPISVWKSTDGGEHFELNRSLWNHPDKDQWGAGYGGAAAHSILPSPHDPDTVHVAMSTGGVYRSTDGGESWRGPQPRHQRLLHARSESRGGPVRPQDRAEDAVEPSTLFAQNHHGVYRSEDNGDNWQSIADGLPSDFGFVMLTHPRKSRTAWVVPIKADGERIPPDGHLAVHRTDDGGATWTRFGTGLPDLDYNVVLRDAAAVDTGGSGRSLLRHPRRLGLRQRRRRRSLRPSCLASAGRPLRPGLGRCRSVVPATTSPGVAVSAEAPWPGSAWCCPVCSSRSPAGSPS